MKIYLKWYYWYKNFWDELLLLWVLNWIDENFNVDEILIESPDIIRLKHRLRINKIFIENVYNKIKYQKKTLWKKGQIVSFFKIIKSFFWKEDFKKYLKIFWWWEVLNPERSFFHKWWIYFQYLNSIKQWNFILIWWIWKPKTILDKILYKILLPKAKNIILRDSWSFEIVKNFCKIKKLKCKYKLYEDFSKKILEYWKEIFLWNKKSKHREYSSKFLSNKKKYILTNLNAHSYNSTNLSKITSFTEKYNWYEKIYFPADVWIQDDAKYYNNLKKNITDLKFYNRTKFSLLETLHLFYNSFWWIWARLHFLYPLKIYKKDIEAIVYKDKVRKIIIEWK